MDMYVVAVGVLYIGFFILAIDVVVAKERLSKEKIEHSDTERLLHDAFRDMHDLRERLSIMRDDRNKMAHEMEGRSVRVGRGVNASLNRRGRL